MKVVEFIELVRKMRHAQHQFIMTGASRFRMQARALERRVDEIIHEAERDIPLPPLQEEPDKAGGYR